MYKNIGIWGFGIVGKSVLEFLASKTYASSLLIKDPSINVLDSRELSAQELELLKKYKANSFLASSKTSIENFLNQNDYIVVSAGINTGAYFAYSSKFIGELDLFAKFFKKPSIAITGTLGKTTVTKLLGELAAALPYMEESKSDLEEQLKNQVAVSGNIGTGLLSLIEDQSNLDLAVLELSSFQLELNNLYAPDICLWTNFYPNHLDRHGSIEAYFEAKFKAMVFQKSSQVSIVSLDLFNHPLASKYFPLIISQLCIVSSRKLVEDEWKRASAFNAIVFYIDDGKLFCNFTFDNSTKQILSLHNMPSITFVDNWALILAALYILGKDLSILENCSWAKIVETKGGSLSLEPHRVEFCDSINHIDFYNDSKSTVKEATFAALDKLSLQNKPIYLLIGGISKGVSRADFASLIRTFKNVSKIIAFGKEADSFEVDFKASNLQEGFKVLVENITPNSIVLLSPGGASFDLFENYEKRGELFKCLVREYVEAAKDIK